MSEDISPPAPKNPGPDWWPRFTWRQAGIWLLQGFLVPVIVFLGVWLVATLVLSVSGDTFFGAESVHQGGLISMLGFSLTGGAIILTQIFQSGVRWRTAFRVVGFTLAMITQWHLSDWILEAWL